jgi:hypothetical protein
MHYVISVICSFHHYVVCISDLYIDLTNGYTCFQYLLTDYDTENYLSVRRQTHYDVTDKKQ